MARRSARRARSVNSVSRRLCSFLGRYSSSSASAASTCSLAATARRAGRVEQRPPRPLGVRRGRASGARANASARARSAGPSPSASASARSPSPSESRAQASAASGATPRDCRRCASAAAGSGSKRTGWQRELIVGSTWVRRSVSRSRTTYGGGSSSVLSSELAASSFIVSARSRTNTRCVGLERRAGGGRHDRLVDVAPQHLVRAARRDPRQVGVRAVLDPDPRRLGIGRFARQQRGREVARRVALAAPGRAVQQVRVRGRAVERGAEDGGGVRVLVEHAADASPACRCKTAAAC